MDINLVAFSFNTMSNYLVFGRDIPNKHDIISPQELYRDFNADEVDVYLKERREQVREQHLLGSKGASSAGNSLPHVYMHNIP